MDQAWKHDLDRFCALSEVLSIIYMGIYACKRLYICINSPKYDPKVLNRCVKYCQLRMNNKLTGFIAFTMCAATLKYGSYVTATLYK